MYDADYIVLVSGCVTCVTAVTRSFSWSCGGCSSRGQVWPVTRGSSSSPSSPSLSASSASQPPWPAAKSRHHESSSPITPHQTDAPRVGRGRHLVYRATGSTCTLTTSCMETNTGPRRPGDKLALTLWDKREIQMLFP